MATFTTSDNNYGTAKLIVDSTTGQGNYTTISAALTAATSGQTIFIRPGTYTENLTLVAGVNLVAYDADALTPNVIINGKCTFTTAGTISISGIQLKTNSDFALAVTGSAASVVFLKNCYLNCLNNTGISHTSSNSASAIHVQQTYADLGTTGIAYFTSTSTGVIEIEGCRWINSGGSSTASNTSTSLVGIATSQIDGVFSTSSSGTITINNSIIQPASAGINAVALTTAGSGTSRANSVAFYSGSASCVSIGTGTTVVMGCCEVSSTNTNPITGLGILINAGVSFLDTGVLINTSTQTGKTFTSGGVSFDGGTNVLSNYVTGTFLPTVQSSNGNMSGISYAAQVGRYTRIGSIVNVYMVIVFTNSTAGTGSLIINNLPFTVKNVASYNPIGPCALQNISFGVAGSYILASAQANTTNVVFETSATIVGSSNVATAAFTNAVIQVSIVYEI